MVLAEFIFLSKMEVLRDNLIISNYLYETNYFPRNVFHVRKKNILNNLKKTKLSLCFQILNWSSALDL